MATLTEASAQARKAIKYGAIGFVAITLLWYVGVYAVKLYYFYFPPAAEPPTVSFGALPSVNFPTSPARPKLLLELPTGVIPQFPDRMWVYKAPTKRSGFADSGRAIDVATALGFLFKPVELSDADWVWTIQDQLNSKLEMNIVSGHFTLTRKWQNNPALATLANFSSKDAVITETENYLQKIGLMESDLVGFEKTTNLKDDAGSLVNALSINDADFVQVDLFRKNVEEVDPNSEKKVVIASYPFFRTDPTKGLVRIIVSGGRSVAEKYISMEYQYTKVDYKNAATYPIKTGDQAWQELASGGGFVTSNSPKAGEIKIRKIQMGYYDADNGQNYAMPIYIFIGDQGFTAYVSAVTEGFIKK